MFIDYLYLYYVYGAILDIGLFWMILTCYPQLLSGG